VEVIDVVTGGPGQGGTERPGRLVAGEEPTPVAGAGRRPAGEQAGFEIEVADVPGDQGAQLGGVERRLLFGRERRGQDSAGAAATDLRLP
jgi:hypothetical protein